MTESRAARYVNILLDALPNVGTQIDPPSGIESHPLGF